MSAALGLVIYAAVKPIFKIYFIIGLGYFLAKRNILTVTTCRDISDMIVTAIMPCLVFQNIVSNLKSSDIKTIGVVFFEASLLSGTGTLLALLTYYVCKSPKAWFGGLVSVGLFANISDLPIAYLQTLSKTGTLFTTDEGDKGVAYVCVFLAAQVFLQFSLGLYKLVGYDFRDQLKNDNDVEKAALDASDSEEKDLSTIPEDASAHVRSSAVSVSSAHGATSPRASSDSASIDSADFEAKLLTEAQGAGEASSHNEATISLRPSRRASRRRSAESQMRRPSISLESNQLCITNSRTADLRSMRSEDMSDVINEYSEFDRLKYNEINQVQSIISERGLTEVIDTADEKAKARLLHRIKAHLLVTLKNFMTPNSATLIVSFAIAMSPPLKALFVSSTFSIPNAPDEQPPLSFAIDITTYIGNASVPLGLLVLGATSSRLQFNSMPAGFWKTVVMITLCRLVVMPIFGVGLTTGLDRAGWYGDNYLIRFVSVLESGPPSGTALIYFTAFYTDPNSPHHLQMDCLAVCLLAQYSILFITLPILVTYTLKVSLGF